MTIEELCQESHETAKEKGWHDTERGIPEMICLMHSELSEALEDFREGKMTMRIPFPHGKPAGFPSEMADVVIRVADTCQMLGIDLTKALRAKMDYNKTREYRHGGKRA